MAEVHTEKNTVFYILYADSIELKDDSVAGQKAALFWYAESGMHHCCEAFDLTQKVRCKYIAFFCLTLPDLKNPAHPITMTLSEPDGDHIGVAFLDVSQFSAEETFQEMTVELLTAAGVVAVVTLFTARQNRWAYEPVEQSSGVFIEWEKDAQAKMLYDHMMSQDTGEEEKPKEEKRDEKKEQQEAEKRKEEQRQRDAEAAEKRRHEEAEEKRRKDEAEERRKREEADEKRRRDEAAAAEEKRRKDEELDREIARRKEEDERRRDDDRRRKEEEERRWREPARADEESRRYRDESEDRRDRQRRWEEEEEAERRRREEFERRKREYMEKELASSPEPSLERTVEPAGRLKERQQWEEDRARLKRDARRVREQEIAEHERRAEERRRQIEALSSARLAPAVAPRIAEPASHKPAPVESKTSRQGARGGGSKESAGRNDGRSSRRGSATAAALRRKDSVDSEASEPCRFDGEDDEEEDGRLQVPAKRGLNSGFRWPRNDRAQRANDTAETHGRRGPGQVVLRGGTQVSSSPAAELSLAERLEHFRSHAQLKRLGAIQRDVVVDAAEGRVPMLETLELATSESLKHQEAAQGQIRSVNNTPRKRSTSARSKGCPEAEGPARRANAVLAAVLADAAGAGFGLAAAPVAAVEESVLRLLVLHKELTAGDVAKSKLADATAGLAPRMLQVLEAAKSVCEANRNKLMAYTEEKQLGIDRSDYLVPQIQALDKLHKQYSTLCPAQGSAPEPPAEEPAQRCECGADFSADARFCRLCGRRRDSAPSSARFSPRPTPASDFQNVSHVSLAAPHPAPSLQSSPVRSVQNTGRQAGFDRVVDPGLPEPLMPSLRPGGSTPPAAKFRQSASPPAPGFGGLQSTPRSDISSVQPFSARQFAPHPGPGGPRGPVVPTIQHWDRHQELARNRANVSPMWDAVAAAVTTEPTAARPATDASPLWDAVAASVAPVAAAPSAISTARSSREARLSPRTALVSGGEPLRAALQQTRGVASELSRRGRGTAGGGAHAGAGSPSPEPRQRMEEPMQRSAPEDKYLKILQSLQAKGAANGGLAAQLLEKQAARGPTRGASKAMSSDSDSSEYLPPRRRVRGR